MPLSLGAEREFARLLTAVEVATRPLKPSKPASTAPPSPVQLLVRAAAAHCIGLLHLKFQPVWKLAQQTFATLAARFTRETWEPMEEVKSKCPARRATE